jgi:hypothetical protein
MAITNAQSISADGAIKRLQRGWSIYPLTTSFYRGGAIYRFFMSNPHDLGSETKLLLSNGTVRRIDAYRTQYGHVALVARSAGRYDVVGKSGITAGHLWKAKNIWILGMHASPPEDFASVKVAKAAALEYALRY